MNTFSFSEVSGYFYSEKQLNLIRNKRIGIAGAGGLGSNCAHVLVRCGFEKLRIADFDKVTLSNLNRQLYYPSHLGKTKVKCLAETLLQINPQLQVETFPVRVDSTNIHQVFDCCDVIVEAFDNPVCKAMLIEEYWGSDKLLVAVSGIGGFGEADRVVTRKIRKNTFVIGDNSSEVSDHVKPYAPSVMIAAAKQADVILNWVLGENSDC